MNPNILCIARPSLDFEGVSKFLGDEGVTWRRTPGASQTEELVELAGRVCYMSFGSDQSRRRTAEYVANLIMSGHDSVLEHASWTFIITGVSRAFTHQLVRHRAGFSFSQLSQQYHDERNATFVEPTELHGSARAAEIWAKHVQESLNAYAQIIDALTEDTVGNKTQGSPKERRRAIRSAARSVLPNATETKIAVTANARALRHFLKVRGAIAGDAEMRKVAVELLKILRADAPSLFADFMIEGLDDGSCQVVHREECLRPAAEAGHRT